MRARPALVGVVVAASAIMAGCGSSGSSAGSGAGTTTGAASSAAPAATTAAGKDLVDGDGRTLYLFTKDTPGKPSVCSGGCATTWPPEVAATVPAAGSGLDASKLTLITRADGTQQVAYAGWPLYRFGDDAKAGDVNGEKVGGVWFAVDATGVAVKG
jgi:predicted lipoprotein with Yx(FWY)xxD motif